MCHRARFGALGAYASNGTALEANDARAQRVLLIVVGYALELALIVGYARAGRHRTHPKYRLNARRSRRLLEHVVLGTLELVLGATALLGARRASGALMRMSAACVLVHALTAIQQIDAAFGTPLIVTPALHIMNAAHVEKALRVLVGGRATPVERARMLENFISQLVLAQGFAYSRIFIFAFTRVPGIKAHRYTTGATLALFLVIPAVYGVAGALLAMVTIAAYSNAYGSEEGGKERDYNAIIDRSNYSMRIISRAGLEKPLRTAFNVLDVNGDGALDKAELREQLKLWGVSQRSVEEFFAHVDASHDGVLSFEEILNDKAGRCMLEYISDCLRDNERVRLRND